jgi:hypothetical protein
MSANQRVLEYIHTGLVGCGFSVLEPTLMSRLRGDWWGTVQVAGNDLRNPQSPVIEMRRRGFHLFAADVDGHPAVIVATGLRRLEERISEIMGTKVENMRELLSDPFTTTRNPEPQRQQPWPPKPQANERLRARDPNRPDAPLYNQVNREIAKRQKEERLEADRQQRERLQAAHERHLAQQRALNERLTRQQRARKGA